MRTSAVHSRLEQETPAQEPPLGSRSYPVVLPSSRPTSGLTPLAGRAGSPCKSGLTEFTHPTGSQTRSPCKWDRSGRATEFAHPTRSTPACAGLTTDKAPSSVVYEGAIAVRSQAPLLRSSLSRSTDRPRVRSDFIGTEARADQIESGDSVIVECAEQVLFDNLLDVAGLLHAEPVEDVQAIGNRLAARTNELEFLCVAEPSRELRRCGLGS